MALPSQIFLDANQYHNGPRPQDLSLAKEITAKLQQHYPGHPWMVWASSDRTRGVAVIKNPLLSQNFGVVKKLRNIKDDPQMRWVERAGAELLERYGIRRGRFERSDYEQARPQFDDVQLVGIDRAQQRFGLTREEIHNGSRPRSLILPGDTKG